MKLPTGRFFDGFSPDPRIGTKTVNFLTFNRFHYSYRAASG